MHDEGPFSNSKESGYDGHIATFGDPDTGVEGFFSKKNKRALDDHQETEVLMQAEIDTIIGESSNENVRKRVFEKARERSRDVIARMTSHAEKQRVNYMNAQGEAREASAAEDMAKSYNDFTIFYRSLETIKEENEDWAIRNGFDPASDVAQVRLLERRGAAIKGSFDAAMTAEDIVVAQRIFSDAEATGQVDAALLAHMKKDLQTETLVKRSQIVADEARSRFPGDLNEQVKYARSVAVGEVRNDALDLLDGAFRRARTIRREGESREADSRAARAQDDLTKIQERFSGIKDQNERDQAVLVDIRDNLSGKDEEAALAMYRRFISDRDGLERESRVNLSHQHTLENRERNS